MDNPWLAFLFVLAAFVSPLVWLGVVFFIVAGGPALFGGLLGRTGRRLSEVSRAARSISRVPSISHGSVGYHGIRASRYFGTRVGFTATRH